jgi:hypothetical protein
MNCTYCGMPAEAKDHIVPISYNYSRRPPNAPKHGGVTVDCCNECNNILSNKFLCTVEARAAELADCLELRYRKQLNAPVWDEEELSELGPSLQRQIRAKQLLRNETVERIRNCVSVAQGLLEGALPVYFSQLDV